jgi:hypothetical protein
LQVVLSERELREIRRAARQAGLTTSEWVRQSLRAARADSPGDPARKLAAVRAAAGHSFPTADVEPMLAEIESGYLATRAE